VPFLVYELQREVDVLQLRGKYGKVPTDVRGYVLVTMYTFVFFNMGGNFLGNGVVMSEDIAKNSFHNVGFRYALVDLGTANGGLNNEIYR
jgi:hypothetical protein